MRPIKLKLAAFEPYVDEIELDFEKHLRGKNMFLIHGETGAGKTSILDAICFALYGDSSGNRTYKMLRSEQADPSKKTFVEFTFALGSKIYKVNRSLNKDLTKNADLFTINVDGTETNIETKDTLVTKKITDLIGFKSEQFCRVVLLPQGQFERFLIAKSDEREKILKILFKTEFYDKLENELKVRAINKLNELNSLSGERDNILTLTEMRSEDELVKSIENKNNKLQITENQQTKLRENRDEANKQLNDAVHLNNKFVELEAKIIESKEAKSKFESTQATYTAAALEYERRKVEEAKRNKIEKDIEDFKKIRQQIDEFKITQNKHEAAMEKFRQAEKDFNKAERFSKTCEDLLAKLKSDKEQYIIESAKEADCKNRAESCKERDKLIVKVNDLKKQIEKADVELKNIVQKWTKQQATFEQLNKQWREGRAAQLAKNLSEGEPCPVCGSIHHPKLAEPTYDMPSDSDLQNAENKLRSLESKKNEANINLASLKTSLEENQKLLEAKRDVGDTKSALAALESAQFAAKELENCTRRIKEGEIKTQNAKLDCENKRQLMSDSRQAAAILAGEYNAQHNNIISELKSHKLEAKNLNAAINEAETVLSSLKSAWTKAEQNYNRLSNQLEADKKAAQIKHDDVEKLKTTLSDKTKPDMAALQKKFNEAENLLHESSGLIAELKVEIKNQKNQLENLKKVQEKIQKIEAESKVWTKLYEVASGKKAQGEAQGKISFSRYALQSKLAKVADSANQRLKVMSNGAYELQYKKEANDKKSSAGLDLEVYDAYHGTHRAVQTLSGGESFLASLSLAMGLADAVQSQYGGIKLDTIFIDEGFGTLDNEKLKKAIKSLIELQAGGRLVGIISHVNSLKFNIDVQLEVTKSESGSTAKFNV